MPRSDRLVSLIESAIALLDEGDLEGAEQKLAQAARIDPQHPDVLSVQASIAAIDGDLERARELSRKALERDPENAGLLINAADFALLGMDAEGALELARRASELVDEEEDLVAVVLLIAQAHLALENPAAAREALAELASSAIDEADLIIDIAHTHLTAEDPTTAELWLRRLASGDDEAAADAWHMIGLCREAKGDHEGMIAAWLETVRRDAAAPADEPVFTDDEIEEIVTAALEELPPEVHTHLAKVPILIDDRPSEDMVKDGCDPRVLGLFDGTPMPEQPNVGGVPTVTTIHIFKACLERACGEDRELLAEEIRVTVLHETAHYFGLEEDDLEKLGLD